MTEIHLFKWNGQATTINKTLGTPAVKTGALRDEFNFTSPEVRIRQKDVFLYNYCYIPAFKRYYFIDSVIVNRNNEYEIRCSVDVLKSYETQILNATATTTQQDNPDPYISSRDKIYSRKPNFEKVDFPNTGLLSDSGSMVMVTIKGNK